MNQEDMVKDAEQTLDRLMKERAEQFTKELQALANKFNCTVVAAAITDPDEGILIDCASHGSSQISIIKLRGLIETTKLHYSQM